MAEDTAIPRPEYPRPQFVRDRWLNLNGEWEFASTEEIAAIHYEMLKHKGRRAGPHH